MRRIDVVFVGPVGNTHVSGSLHRAALAQGLSSEVIDVAPAYRGPALLRSLSWRLAGHRPFRLRAFSKWLLNRLSSCPPGVIVTLGQAPVDAAVVRALREKGVRCINFSTDDPFGPAHVASWQLASLKEYDYVFTTRRANIDDMRRLPCRHVSYLPFGYDQELFLKAGRNGDYTATPAHSDVLFVGGADIDRAAFFNRFSQAGLVPALVGGYWERYQGFAAERLGIMAHDLIGRLTAQAAVNLCLVRRANRDGHVMRSFEIPAVGGFMIAEDTAEHRELFGEEGKAVLYFGSPEQAADKCRWALANASERHRMADAARVIVTSGGHTYRDRLRTMIETAAP